MKAAVVKEYGSHEVVKIIDLPKPTPQKNEVLVKVIATAVTAGDSRIRGARFPEGFGFLAKLALGFAGPRSRVLGTEFSGVVEEVGEKVKDFKVGDEVIGFKIFNVHAEYTCIRESGALVHKPNKLSFAEAAAIPFGGSTALYFTMKANLKSGESILINGASGEVGVMAVQIAKIYGAEVTAVSSEKNHELLRKLGADFVIDYSKEVNWKKEKLNSYDVIFDLVGNMDFDDSKELLKDNGRFVAAVAGLPDMLTMKLMKSKSGKKFISGTAPEKKQDLQELVNFVEQGRLNPVIGKSFQFEEIAKAHEYVDTGHKVGTAVVLLTKNE